MSEIEDLRKQVADLAARVAELERRTEPRAMAKAVLNAPVGEVVTGYLSTSPVRLAYTATDPDAMVKG